MVRRRAQISDSVTKAPVLGRNLGTAPNLPGTLTLKPAVEQQRRDVFPGVQLHDKRRSHPPPRTKYTCVERLDIWMAGSDFTVLHSAFQRVGETWY